MRWRAHPEEPNTWSALPPVLRESWQRSAQYLTNPLEALAPIDLGDQDLGEYRREHRLAQVLPVFENLLIRHAAEAGLIVAIGDAHGQLLWVDGARPALREGESSAFQPGANWSEESIGTSAPGTALATGRGVQVHREEHFAPVAHKFSCSAAPIRCPHTGSLLGVVDLTGGPQAVATHALPLIQAAISAAEAELRALPPLQTHSHLTALGGAAAQLSYGAAHETLSLRHAEILVLLAWYRSRRRCAGLSAAELAEQIYGEPGHEVALRAELVRLRRVLLNTPAGAGVELLSRPYRFSRTVQFDANTARDALLGGDVSTALDVYSGPLLPASEAPGILAIRYELGALLREAVLQNGTGEHLWRYLQLPEAEHDREAIMTALQVLPPEAPQRAALVSRMS